MVTFPLRPTHRGGGLDTPPARPAGMSTHLWMLDVLGNLKSYADAQGLVQLSNALSDCGDVALDELRAQEFGHTGPAPEDA
ncbi:hypothetical protein [Aliiroseovarius sp.]|uniref:hypothetical protein n=1 Tax=Aliiroseovarius sp. TaxID=1872442 RepID=UPI003BA9AB63